MSSPWQTPLADGRRPRRRRTGGFALAEAGLLLLICALAAGLVVLLLGRFQQRRRCDRYAADLREFAAAFQSYAQQHKGEFPASASEGAMPVGMEDLLKETNWRKGSPFGGNYEWVRNASARPPAHGAGFNPGRGGAIILTAFAPSFPLALSKRDLLCVDAMIDDGNSATGRFRTGFNGWPVYFVGESR